MISQETKDRIDREIEAEAYKWDAYYQNEDSFIMPARLFRFGKHVHNQMLTKYAEKLEEKDKIIEYKDKEIKELEKQLILNEETEIQFIEQLKSKDRELAQLKEIGSKLFNSLRDLDFMLSVFDPKVSQNDIRIKVFTLMDMSEKLNGANKT